MAPIAIFVGLAGSKAIRPLLGEAKNAALAEDFVGAVVILAILRVLRPLVQTMAKRESIWVRGWERVPAIWSHPGH